MHRRGIPPVGTTGPRLSSAAAQTAARRTCVWPTSNARAEFSLSSFRDVQRICRGLDPYLAGSMLSRINGDIVWGMTQGELKRGNAVATVNRYLALVRSLLRMARDEWQWLDCVPKVRLLTGEVERDRWLTGEEANRLIAAYAPHLAASVPREAPCHAPAHDRPHAWRQKVEERRRVDRTQRRKRKKSVDSHAESPSVGIAQEQAGAGVQQHDAGNQRENVP